ncbi:hypothetical protein F511_33295 [Dorcoceras hygrometricum]|uniref:Uncharacterized protein n=1 Tax=Dorcoceras hygrometricum TaxID=472368 RepID=A0A2Z7CJH4_9LAMI|nr:hypothetical protein F511_33295 [Dorcoceras hygrometricum]
MLNRSRLQLPHIMTALNAVPSPAYSSARTYNSALVFNTLPVDYIYSDPKSAQSIQKILILCMRECCMQKAIKKYAVICLWNFEAEYPTSPIIPHEKDPLEDLITVASGATRSDNPQAERTPIHQCAPACRLCV